jgi:basic membrane protein A
VWGIGVDSDQYNTVDPAVQEYVLTSMIKRVDVAVYNITEDVVNGTFEPGEQRYDLAADGVGYSTSGGFVDDIVPQLEEAKAAIIAGDVVVPTDPTLA